MQLDDIEDIEEIEDLETTEDKLTDEEMLKKTRLLNYMDGRNETGERWDDVIRKRDKDNPNRKRVQRANN